VTEQPGDRRRQLDRAPSERYGTTERRDTVPERSLVVPLAGSLLAAVAGAAILVVVGAVLASTFGLLFVAGVMGAAIGLLLAGADLARGTILRLALALALLAVAVADVVTWLYAQSEGGVLGLFDYLWTTFGPFVPAVPIVAILGAAWGAAAGPVRR